MLAVNLSVRLDVLALVRHYHTNKLISHEPLFNREARRSPALMQQIFTVAPHPVLAAVSSRYSKVKGELLMYY